MQSKVSFKHTKHCVKIHITYCICQIIRGEKLSWFLWIFANCECFTIEIFLEYQCHLLTTQSIVPPGLKFSTVKVFPTY